MTRAEYDKSVKAGKIRVWRESEPLAVANVPVWTEEGTIWNSEVIRIWEKWEGFLAGESVGKSWE